MMPMSMQQPKAMGIDLDTSNYGRPIPLIYGTNKVSGNCVWYGDFKAQQVSIGGKGGGGGTTQWDYQASFMLGICEGPIVSWGNVWQGSSFQELAVTNPSFQANGAVGQAPWSHFGGVQAVGYSGTVLIAWQNIDLGGSADTPQYQFELTALKPYSVSIVDANPSDILSDVCTDVTHGIGFNFLGNLTQYSNYCVANNLFLSPVYDSEGNATSVISDLLDWTNSIGYWSEGQFKVVPLGDVAITGNGVTYTPALTSQHTFTDSDYITSPGRAPVAITRKAASDCLNTVRIEYCDRGYYYYNMIAEARDQEDALTNGVRSLTTQQVHACTQAATARFIAQNKLQRTYYIRNTYHWSASWQWAFFEPSDIVSLSDTTLGLDGTPVRITSITEDDRGNLEFQAEELLIGVGHSSAYAPPTNSGATLNINVDPGPVVQPLFFRMPGALAGVSQGNPTIGCAITSTNPNWGAAQVFISRDGTTYDYLTTWAKQARYGLLANSVAVQADPDTISAPQVTLESGALIGTDQTSADNLATLSLLDSELISYKTATLVSGETYNLGYLRRGCYGTAIASHSVGASFVRLDDNVLRIPIDPSMVGQTVYLKFLSLNIFSKTPRNLSEETAYSYIVGSDASLPDVPAPPASFAGQSVTDGVNNTWTLPNPAAVACVSIERSPDNATWLVLGQVGPTSTSYHDAFTNGASYYYRARCRGALPQAGWSAYTASILVAGTNVASQTAADTVNVNGLPSKIISQTGLGTNVAYNRQVISVTAGTINGRGPFALGADQSGTANYYTIPTASLPASLVVDLGVSVSQLSLVQLSSWWVGDTRYLPSAGTIDGSNNNVNWTAGIGSWSNVGTDPIAVVISGQYRYIRINLTGAPLAPSGQTNTHLSGCRIYAWQGGGIHNLDLDVGDGVLTRRTSATYVDSSNRPFQLHRATGGIDVSADLLTQQTEVTSHIGGQNVPTVSLDTQVRETGTYARPLASVLSGGKVISIHRPTGGIDLSPDLIPQQSEVTQHLGGANVPTVDFLAKITGRTADRMTYLTGGVSVDSLKPQEAGANVTETRTSALTNSLSNHVISDNLVQNGDFTNGMVGWNVPSGWRVSQYNNDAGKSGTGLFINTITTEQTVIGTVPCPIEQNKTYLLECWVYCSTAGATNYIGFAEFDNLGNSIQHDAAGADYGYALLSNGSISGYQYFVAEITGNGGTAPTPTQFNQATASIVPVCLFNYGAASVGEIGIQMFRISEVAAGARRAVTGLQSTGILQPNLHPVDNLKDQTYARMLATEMTGGTHKLGIAGSGKRVGDGRNLIALNTAGYATAYWTGITFTPHPTSLDVSAGTLHLGGASISYNSSSVGSLANSTLYSLYYNDPAYAGGAQTLGAAPNKQAVSSNDGYIYIGDGTTQTSGGTGGGGGIGPCLTPRMYLRPNVPAAIAAQGTKVDGAENYRKIGELLLLNAWSASGPAVRITASDGAQLECGETTPFDMPDGTSKTASALVVGDHVLTDTGDCTVTALDSLGCQPLVYVSCGGKSFAAGADATKRIYSHNTQKP